MDETKELPKFELGAVVEFVNNSVGRPRMHVSDIDEVAGELVYQCKSLSDEQIVRTWHHASELKLI